MATNEPRRIYPGLDLARALAILLVLVSHWGDTIAAFHHTKAPAWLSESGTFGVELFFSLSGFLIGGLLIRILRSNPNWRAWRIFMIRRWMRTLPLYWLAIIVMAFVWTPMQHSWRHFVAYTFFLQNWAWPMPADNWFGVSWSLTIEEWFYLLFSITLISATIAWGSSRGFRCTLGAFIAVPLLARIGLSHLISPGDAYKIALLRLDAIAYGVALAGLQAERSRLFLYPRAAATVGGLLILAVWARFNTAAVPIPTVIFQSFYLSLIAIGFCLCLAGAIALPKSAFGLFAPVIEWLSHISYGIYIIHLTVLEMVSWGWAEGRLSALSATAIMMVVPPVLATLSFRYFESPILARRPRQPEAPSPAIGPAFAAMVSSS